ncbi:MAG TPA: DUF2490 domain-containing protein [Burkholderiales bacterium]|nr:DUF2490 domain-containing protein [Burkholderiales bacterium]
MSRRPGTCGRLLAAATLLLAPVGVAVAAQHEFWPELDGYFKLDDRARVFAAAASTHAQESDLQNGNWQTTDAQASVALDYTLKPLFRTALGDQDWERNRYLWLRVGYTRVGNFDDDGNKSYNENRGVFEIRSHQPVLEDWGLDARLRWEARDIDDRYSNRYRVRLHVEREIVYDGHALAPYVEAEVFYDTRYDTWNRHTFQAGVDIPLGRSWRIEPYLVYQDDNRSQSQYVSAFGLTLKFYH